MPSNTEQRFMAKVQKTPNGCWHWTAAKDNKGYGRFAAGGRNNQAYAWAYRHFVGPVPEGFELDHTCRNRACVNPAHLEPVPHKVNVLRGSAPSAQHAQKPRCPRCNGQYTTRRDGHRYCAACADLKNAEYRAAHREDKRLYDAIRRAARRLGVRS